MDLFDIYETDSKLENDGIVLNFGPSKVTVARQGGSNLSYMKELSDELNKLGKTGSKSLDFIEESELIKRVFCKAVIKNHEIKNDSGEFVSGCMIKKDGKKEIVPYNTENMMTMLDQLPEYYIEIKKYADDYKTYRALQVKEQEKN